MADTDMVSNAYFSLEMYYKFFYELVLLNIKYHEVNTLK